VASIGQKRWPNKTKPGREENPQAGLTHPRPFSYLFYVASKPAGSNDHGISLSIPLIDIGVNGMIGYDICYIGCDICYIGYDICYMRLQP
jgi:hypothetical protein